MTRLCRPVEDLGLKNWLDNQEVCDVLRINKRPFRRIVPKVSFLSVASRTSFSTTGRYTEIIGIELPPFNKEQIMSYHFIDKKDPRIDVMFQGLEKMERMLSVMEDVPRSLFNGERFLTDEELSKVLRVSRRTLQEYRTFGVIPYYLVQGKALYKESDIMKILDDAYKRCREEQRWV